MNSAVKKQPPGSVLEGHTPTCGSEKAFKSMELSGW